MTTRYGQLTLTFHEHLTRIAAAPTAAAQQAAEAELARFLRRTLKQIEHPGGWRRDEAQDASRSTA